MEPAVSARRAALLLLSVLALGSAVEVSERLSYFDREVLQWVAEQPGNVVVSPVSVKTTLAMLWEGAGGTSAEEIRKALRISGSKDHQRDQLHEFHNALKISSPNTLLQVVSQAFLSEKIEANPKYLNALKAYDADVTKVNMAAPDEAAGTINNWVNNVTNGLITNLIDPASLSEGSLMVLGNAVYFRGTWEQAFDRGSTRKACFYSTFNDCKHVEMMETVGNFSNRDLPDLEAMMVELPYEDPRYSMVLVLPDRRNGLPQLAKDLPHWALFRDLKDSDMEYSEIMVSLPKFSIEFETDLVPALSKALKVSEVFTPKANLCAMLVGDQQPVVSNVFHKAKIEVNEEGATAGAASGAVVVPLMGGPQKRFYGDHPFLFFIRDKLSGGFLFAGRVEQPQFVPEPAKENEATPLQSTVRSQTMRPGARPDTVVAADNSSVNFPDLSQTSLTKPR